MSSTSNRMRYTDIPLPVRKYIPGKERQKYPDESHIPEIPADMGNFGANTWKSSKKYLYAIDLFNFGYWWEAHVILEDLWIQAGKTTLTAKFIQGIIQISAALVKDSQSMPQGAIRLATKGLSKLQLHTGIFLGLNVKEFEHDVERYFAGKISLVPQIILRDLNDN